MRTPDKRKKPQCSSEAIPPYVAVAFIVATIFASLPVRQPTPSRATLPARHASPIAVPGWDDLSRLRTPSLARASRSTSPAAKRVQTVRPVVSGHARNVGVVGGWSTTRASWYDIEPSACWDKRGRHPFPAGTRRWTAHKTLPCGTIIEIEGPSGTRIRVPILDRGPYVAGRALDLSKAAFAALASPSRGVLEVKWRVA